MAANEVVSPGSACQYRQKSLPGADGERVWLPWQQFGHGTEIRHPAAPPSPPAAVDEAALRALAIQWRHNAQGCSRYEQHAAGTWRSCARELEAALTQPSQPGEDSTIDAAMRGDGGEG